MRYRDSIAAIESRMRSGPLILCMEYRWEIGDRDFEMTKSLDLKNPDFAICDIAIQSQPLNQEVIWTVDLTPYRSFVNRDFEVTKTLDNKNLEIAICDFAI
jgi:hypothetical protein